MAVLKTYDPTSGTWVALGGSGGGSATTQLLHVQDEKASGTHGGSAVGGAWTNRELNTVKVNDITGASLASNLVTLPAGTYDAEFRAPFTHVNAIALRLYDTTNGVVLVRGPTDHSGNGESVWTGSSGRGRFTLAGTAQVALQYRAGQGWNNNGLGLAASFGEPEIYAQLFTSKIS